MKKEITRKIEWKRGNTLPSWEVELLGAGDQVQDLTGATSVHMYAWKRSADGQNFTGASAGLTVQCTIMEPRTLGKVQVPMPADAFSADFTEGVWEMRYAVEFKVTYPGGPSSFPKGYYVELVVRRALG